VSGPSRSESVRERVDRIGERAVGVVFGDRLGLLVFLGALAFFVSVWRIDVLLNDSRVMANTLVNVAEGRLAVTELPYSSLRIGSAVLPGFVEVDGQLYGRNYGHLFAAVPLAWALEGLAAVVDPRLLLAGLWSLLLVGVGALAAGEFDRPRLHTAGGLVALVLFAGNVATAVDLARVQLPLVALGLTTMVAAALTAVLLYRLVARFEGRAVGAAAGAAVALASPVAFWSSFPKRHAVSVAVVAAVVYGFAVSREPGRRAFLVRVGTYAVVGLHTLVHPREALLLLLVLAPLDLLSAPSNGLRRLGAIAGVFALSVVPFLAVNTLISGDPLAPPRVLLDGSIAIQPPEPEPAAAEGGAGGGSGGGAGSAGGGSGGSADDSGGSGGGLLAPLWGVVGAMLGPLRGAVGVVASVGGEVYRPLVGGVETLSRPEGLYRAVVRSGRVPGIGYRPGGIGIELAFLETFPLGGALVGAAVAAAGRARRRVGLPGSPAAWTDLLAVGIVLSLGLANLGRLPLVAQVTPRYLLPLVAPLLYLLARAPAVAAAVSRPRWLAGGYAATVLVGGAVLVGAFAAIDPARGEAMQLHALAALAAAAAGGLALGTRRVHEDPRLLAAGLALPAGVATLFVALAGLVYFPPGGTGAEAGSYALGLARVAADLLAH
jgi:uncharacterized membrane protein YgcG